METVEGRIEKKAEGQAKTGAKFWTFTVSGKNYNTFDNATADKFNVGDLVKLGLEQKGQYKNLVSIEALTELSPKVPQNGSNSEISEAIKGIIVNRTERANSFEFGKATARHKIYYDNLVELKAKIDGLVECGLAENPYLTQLDNVNTENESNKSY